jgi:uracil-DNA glycosylase
MSSLKRKATALEATAEAKKPKATIDGSITSFFGAPKSSSLGRGSASSAMAVKFDKKKWAEGLTAEQRGLLKLEIETLDESWLAHLKEEVVSKEFLELKRFLKREKEAGKKIFPPEADVYSWWVGLFHRFVLGRLQGRPWLIPRCDNGHGVYTN